MGPCWPTPKRYFLVPAAQFGIFATVMGAIGLSYAGILDFSIQDAASIGIIGGADGPTAIYVASLLSPDLLGAIAVAGLFLYGAGADYSATYHESTHHRE